MVISFNDDDIRTICEDMDIAQSQLGLPAAHILQTRLSEMVVAETVEELPMGKPANADNSYLKIELAEGYRLIFCSSHVKTPMIDDKVNWAEVKRIKILKIEKYNEQR